MHTSPKPIHTGHPRAGKTPEDIHPPEPSTAGSRPLFGYQRWLEPQEDDEGGESPLHMAFLGQD
ncbi:hypothetical protein SAMN02949497_0164 [Methylomagnum ishizawai]|uniref:Uncharacterized protein n=1 Tax=Methylomagnum ishizawai TaxID=1760988 RepID=A0A1Y6DBY9_9GAMM|nr:hypothetical protein [Methylomagnum ishizawai]SMF97594.1 hypothetical protein SAMN02949497_0164 [Methylomagnum ishizawai]